MSTFKHSRALITLLSVIGVTLWALSAYTSSAQIVNNSATAETSEDSVTVALLSLDSLGNPTGADSFFVQVFGGGKANARVFADSGDASMAGLDTVRIGGATYYYYSRKVADIDGAGAVGPYSGLISAKATTLNLTTATRFGFQIVGWELDDIGDSTGLAARSAKAAHDTLDAGFASLAAVSVASLAANSITAAAFADQALDSAAMDNSWKEKLWRHDTAGVNVGFGSLLKDVGAYQASGFSTFDPASDSVFTKGGAVDSNRTEQGGSGDSISIARWVWNTPSANHSTSATFGDFLDTKVSAISGGSGAYSVTFIVFDSAIAQVVPGALVTVLDITQSAVLAVGGTDNSGAVSYNLDADSFVVTVSQSGKIFPAFDTVVVGGAAIDTLRGYNFDPGAPGAPNRVRVWGVLWNIAGQADSGAVVSAHLPGGVAQSSLAILSPFTVTAITDSTGFFFLDLIPNAQIMPDTTKYEFTIYHSDGAVLRKRLAAPDSLSWRLTW